jgi:hypothetical protein
MQQRVRRQAKETASKKGWKFGRLSKQWWGRLPIMIDQTTS